jgi:hypothetical protein
MMNWRRFTTQYLPCFGTKDSTALLRCGISICAYVWLGTKTEFIAAQQRSRFTSLSRRAIGDVFVLDPRNATAHVVLGPHPNLPRLDRLRSRWRIYVCAELRWLITVYVNPRGA